MQPNERSRHDDWCAPQFSLLHTRIDHPLEKDSSRFYLGSNVFANLKTLWQRKHIEKQRLCGPPLGCNNDAIVTIDTRGVFCSLKVFCLTRAAANRDQFAAIDLRLREKLDIADRANRSADYCVVIRARKCASKV